MKQNRRIPFGYRIAGAGFGIDEKEADCVRAVFHLYITGKTLVQITEFLNEKGVPYHESNPIWNKSMVYRLLTNRKYLGLGAYPEIIEKEIFDAAAEQAEGRKKFRPANCPTEHALQNKIFCGCGARLHKTENGSWVCGSCENIGITEEALMELIRDAFHQISQDASIIHVSPKDVEYMPSTEIMKLTNDIRHRIDSLSEDEAEDIKADILRCALLKYQSVEEDLTPYISRTLCEEFEKSASQDISHTALIEKTVASITLAEAGKIQIKLRNGAIITAARRP